MRTIMLSLLAVSLLLPGCDAEDEIEGYDALEKHVKNNRVGSDIDQWIEMKNSVGMWERTGLVFGYYGDHDECEKAIAGLKQVNYEREYRCTPAN